MKTWLLLCSIVLVITVLLSGCIGQKTQIVPVAEPPAVFVDYYRTGGTAGQNAHLVIFDNGASIISTRTASTEFSLNRTDLDRITGLFALAQYPALSTNYPVSRPGAVLTNYSIRYQNTTIMLQETAIPPVIQPVLDELNRIVARAEAQKTDRPFVNVKL